VSIYIEGNELRNGTVSNSTAIGTLSNDRTRIALAQGASFYREELFEIAKFIEPMTRAERGQTDPPAASAEEANRPRVISQTGNNLFRGFEGAIGDSNPIGSIEDGPVFDPAPGVNLSHHELLDIAQRLKQKAEAAKA
jgi:hypothetical protein